MTKAYKSNLKDVKDIDGTLKIGKYSLGEIMDLSNKYVSQHNKIYRSRIKGLTGASRLIGSDLEREENRGLLEKLMLMKKEMLNSNLEESVEVMRAITNNKCPSFYTINRQAVKPEGGYFAPFVPWGILPFTTPLYIVGNKNPKFRDYVEQALPSGFFRTKPDFLLNEVKPELTSFECLKPPEYNLHLDEDEIKVFELLKQKEGIDKAVVLKLDDKHYFNGDKALVAIYKGLPVIGKPEVGVVCDFDNENLADIAECILDIPSRKVTFQCDE